MKIAQADVVSVRLDVAPEAADELAACLSEDERRRAHRFHFERDRRRYMVARGRLRHLLASRLNVSPRDVELAYGSGGKPRLARPAELLTFNVSHAGDVAAVAFSHGLEVGIDIEAVRELPDADQVAARFFSRRENEVYLALDPSDKPAGFFNCWTRKEAFIKAIGDGLSYPLDRFDVTLAPGERARILRVGEASGEDCGWSLYAFSPGPGLVGAVVVQDSRVASELMAGHP